MPDMRIDRNGNPEEKVKLTFAPIINIHSNKLCHNHPIKTPMKSTSKSNKS